MRVVACACPLAQAKGVAPGQRLTSARAVCPELLVHEADPAGDATALRKLAATCERYTPLAAPDEPDGLWLDITGCAHLWGSEQALARNLAARLAHRGHRSRVAVAGTPGAAWALTRTGSELCLPGVDDPACLPEELARLPVAALRLDARTASDLRRVGLRTVGQVARLPRAGLSARFGPTPVLRLDQMTGRMTEPIAWPCPPVPWEERLAFAEPVLAPEDLQRVLLLLAERLCARLLAAEQGGRRFTAEFFRVDGARPALSVSTSLPVREPAYLHKLLAAKLDTVDPGFGIEVARLSTDRTAPLRAVQTEFAGDTVDGQLAAVLDRVVNHSQPRHVWRTAPGRSHVPERASVRVPPTETPRWPAESLERPFRLMRPEPIEVLALLPDHPPAQFVWRGVRHRVRAATGPERIAREWWRGAFGGERPETDRVRDYYRLEDAEGARFWVFRAGLSSGRWFLHGVFG